MKDLENHVADSSVTQAAPRSSTSTAWRSIESAPLDGTIILITRGEDRRVYAAYYGLAAGVYSEEGLADASYPWILFDSQFGLDAGTIHGSFKPTYWMPLPNPKTAEGNQ